MFKFSSVVPFLIIVFFTSCVSSFSWEKRSEVSTKLADKIPSKFRAWERASRDSAKLAPLPEENKEAVVQIYSAPLWGLRGLVADHTWISTKPKGAVSYTVYEVIGWRMATGHTSVLRVEKDIPDRLWYGKKPRILFDLFGGKAEQIIDRIHRAAFQYPYKKKYAMLGPNSNTFIAWILCKVPELNLKLSRRAIGKGYLKDCRKENQSDGSVKPGIKAVTIKSYKELVLKTLLKVRI